MQGRGPVLFVGVGRIGTPIAERLIGAGHLLHVCDDSNLAVGHFRGLGATVVERSALFPLAYARAILCLPDPDAVRQFVEDWAATGVADGSVVIDLTTVAPSAARSFSKQLQAVGVDYLEAPVSGGQRGADSGEMVIMASGRRSAFDAAATLLRTMATTVHYVGGTGRASLLKAVNQYVYLAYNYAFAQGIRLAHELQLPEAIVLDVLSKGAPAHPLIVDRLEPARSSGFKPGFSIRRCLKDLDCLESGDSESDALVLHEFLRERLRQAVAEGRGDLDILSLGWEGKTTS